MSTSPAPSTGTRTTAPLGQPAPEAPPSAPPEGQAGTARDERTFTRTELETAVKESLERQRRSIEAERAKREAEAKAEAETQSLAEQARWKDLAEQQDSKLKELGPQVDTLGKRIEALEAALRARASQDIKDWPKAVKEFLPPLDGDPLVLWTQVEKSRSLVDELTRTKVPAGNNAGPRPAGGPGASGDEAARQAQAAQLKRRF